jgi:hypothetical protein
MSLPPLSFLKRLLLLAAVLCCTVSDAATIVREKQPTAVILIAQQSSEQERLAAQELGNVVSRIAGAQIPTENISSGELKIFLKSTLQKNQVPIVLGSLADVHTPLTTPLARGGFVLEVTDEAIFIHGEGEGVRYAVSELLEQQGVRWFAPGDLFTVLPSLTSIHVPNQSLKQEPSFSSRWFQMPDKDWQVRLRCGGDTFPGAHGLPVPSASLNKATGQIAPAENADLFSLVAGVRTLRQHCISNPRLLDWVVESVRKARAKGDGPVIGMGPNDGRGFCECDNCKKLDGTDFDPFSNEPSMTDRYIWFFNQVLERVTPEYPDTRIAFYIYHSYMRPPVRWKPHPQIMGALAPIGLDRVHGFSNPLSPERHYAHWLYSAWCSLLPEIYDRGYWSNLACPGFPFPIVHRLRDEIPACKALGLRGWRVETFPNYASQLPSLYIAAKLMWNHEADVDALLKDFHAHCFGPAAAPMARYTTLMDNAVRDSDHCTGSAWDMPFFYPAATQSAANAALAQAAALAAESPYKERVATITRTFRLLEEFIRMRSALSASDFPAAAESLKRMDAHASELMETKPVPMLSAGRFSTYVNYMRRFFRPATEDGFKRVSGGNRLVAAAKDLWDFQIDPLRLGETLGWWRPEVRGGNWQQIRSTSSSWSNQGLRYYKGLAWYRQTVRVPDEFAGKRIFLWCGGVDEKAKIWLNGTPVGVSHGAAFYPFELDATPSVRVGENVITVCVVNEVVNELGTGGIVAPLFLYAPADGPNARIDNGKFELKATFP